MFSRQLRLPQILNLLHDGPQMREQLAQGSEEIAVLPVVVIMVDLETQQSVAEMGIHGVIVTMGRLKVAGILR